MPTAPGKHWRARGGRRGARSPRDPHWDNVRLVAGTLVVVGHLTESLEGADGLRWLNIATWAMRVPVFVLLAGYFSSAGAPGFRELRRLSESVLVPYLLIGLLHTLQLKLSYGTWKFFTTEPAWGLWFLLSLFLWRLLLPCLAVLRYPLFTSLCAALAVGYIDGFGAEFSASRTVTFLPFFLLGQKLRQGLADEILHARWTRLPAAGVLAVTAVAGWVFRNGIDTSWLAMQAPYAGSVPFAPQWAWGLRGAVLLCGMVIALSFVRLVPKRRLPVATWLGAGGLYIYLLHPLAVRALTAEGFVRAGPWPHQLALTALAVALAAALASAPVRWVARPLVQPRLPWLYAQQPTAPAQVQEAAAAQSPAPAQAAAPPAGQAVGGAQGPPAPDREGTAHAVTTRGSP